MRLLDLVCLLHLLAPEPVTGVWGGGALHPQRRGPALGFAPEAEAMARPLGEAGPACPVSPGLIFHARRHPVHAELTAHRI